jgi:hypothetical protein
MTSVPIVSTGTGDSGVTCPPAGALRPLSR